MRLYLLAALSLALIGCASSGPKIDASRLSDVRKGETTIAEIVKRFGRPSVLSKNMDGTQTAAYVHVEGKPDAVAFVPLLSALAGKAEANVDSVIFSFDTKGILSDYRITEAKADNASPGDAAPAASAGADQAAPASANQAAAPNANRPAPTNAGSSTKSATQTEKKAATSKPWTIESWQPIGQKENR